MQLVKKETDNETVKNLSDELGIMDPRTHNVSPECDVNDKNPRSLKSCNWSNP